jgi:hypothetical protein
MATINNKQLAQMRREYTKGRHPDYPKATLNAAFQGYEDYLQTTQSGGITAFNTATSPYVFSNADKKVLAAIVFKFKYGEDK